MRRECLREERVGACLEPRQRGTRLWGTVVPTMLAWEGARRSLRGVRLSLDLPLGRVEVRFSSVLPCEGRQE